MSSGSSRRFRCTLHNVMVTLDGPNRAYNVVLGDNPQARPGGSGSQKRGPCALLVASDIHAGPLVYRPSAIAAAAWGPGTPVVCEVEEITGPSLGGLA